MDPESPPYLEPATALVRLGTFRYHQAMSNLAKYPSTDFVNGLEEFKAARNKWSSYLKLSPLLPMPHSQLTPLPTPCIYKEFENLQGHGVHLLQSEKDLTPKLESQGFYQSFIQEAQGQDIRVMVINGQCIGAIQRTNESQFRSNISQGGRASPISPSVEIESMALEACKQLGLFYAGVDIIFSKNGPLLLEVNPSPGFEAFENATGINFAKNLIENIIAKYASNKLTHF